MSVYNSSLDWNLTTSPTSTPSLGGDNLVVLVVACLVMGLCFLLGLPSNLYVIYSTRGQTTKLTLLLVLNLAVSDTLSLGSLPVVLYVLVQGWTLGDWSCSLLSYLLNCCLYASVLTITLMSITQYQAIKSKTVNHTLQERLRSTWKYRVSLLGGLWFLSCLLATPTLFTRQVVEKGDHLLRCQRSCRKDWHKVAVLLFETLAGFIVPCCILIGCYLSLHKKVTNQIQSQDKDKMSRLNWLVARILLCFILLWLPYHVINVVDICTTLLKDSNPGAYAALKSFRNISDAVKTFSFINSCLNPFLYAHMQRKDEKQKQRDLSKSTQTTDVELKT